MHSEPFLKLILRVLGSTSLLAIIFVVAPEAWMDSIHQSLGMGALSNQPVVGYLARSTSAFYAMLGGLMWLISFDLRRHRQVLIYLGTSITLFGAVLLGVDWLEGMPRFWIFWEGPFVILFGLVILWLIRPAGSHQDGGS